jgi:hypothetical protein
MRIRRLNAGSTGRVTRRDPTRGAQSLPSRVYAGGMPDAGYGQVPVPLEATGLGELMAAGSSGIALSFG